MKALIISLLFQFTIVAEAIVHVGNGGGDAEMLTLQLVPGLTKWAATCNKNPGLCGSDIYFNDHDIQALSTTIAFVEAAEHQPTCLANRVQIIRESLYTNNDNARNLYELSSILIKTILSCAGWNTQKLNKLIFDLDFRARTVTEFGLLIFNGLATDVIDGSENFSLQKLLIQRTQCSKYRIISSVNNYLNLFCLTNQKYYLVLVKANSGHIDFISRIDSRDPE